MRSLRLASFITSSVLALALLGAGSARADVAPGPDAGGKTDMASTMAHPDMSAAGNTNDGGCSLAQHGQPGGLALGFAAAALALVVSRRRRAV